MNRHRYYKNECPFDGPRDLVPHEHMGCRSLIPRKCADCRYDREGECTIFTIGYKMLDYGPCGIEGPTYLVEVPGLKYPVPAKCVDCPYFYRYEIVPTLVWCTKDLPEGFGMGRGLDYGDAVDEGG